MNRKTNQRDLFALRQLLVVLPLFAVMAYVYLFWVLPYLPPVCALLLVVLPFMAQLVAKRLWPLKTDI
jgi:hypothetical protein